MHLILFGLGYSGAAIAREAVAAGLRVTATVRTPQAPMPGVTTVGFTQAQEALASATHLVTTAPPGEGQDPVLAAYGPAIADAARAGLVWIGYLSTTGVYGDRQGGRVDETTYPTPASPRANRRLVAENAWRAVAGAAALDIMRLAGIYGPGPGRSPLEDLRLGTARRIIAPNHRFSRIHRDDIAGGALAALQRPAGQRVLNFADDEPAPSADVIEEAARLLGIAPPPAQPLEQARKAMSPMARSFWNESRRVDSTATQAAIGRNWSYPTYREGLRAILAAEAG